MNRRLQRAFTVIEIIVTTSIIIALSALIHPVLVEGKNRSKDISCLNNLKQLGVAIHIYASEWDDHLPLAASESARSLLDNGISVYGDPYDTFLRRLPTVSSLLGQYGSKSQLFQCSRDCYSLSSSGIRDCSQSWFERIGSSYFFDDWNAINLRTLSQYPEPSKNMMMGDYSFFHSGQTGETGQFNVLFVDGRAKKTRWTERNSIVVER